MIKLSILGTTMLVLSSCALHGNKPFSTNSSGLTDRSPSSAESGAAEKPNIGSVYSQKEGDAVRLISSLGLKEYYCDVSYENTGLSPRHIYAKNQPEAFERCLNSYEIMKFEDADRKVSLHLRLPEGNIVTVKGLAVRLGNSEAR